MAGGTGHGGVLALALPPPSLKDTLPACAGGVYFQPFDWE